MFLNLTHPVMLHTIDETLSVLFSMLLEHSAGPLYSVAGPCSDEDQDRLDQLGLHS